MRPLAAWHVSRGLCLWPALASQLFFFLLNDSATTEIYTLSLHDALPISASPGPRPVAPVASGPVAAVAPAPPAASSATPRDRKSTRLNSSHTVISYAVFCLKKKKRGRRRSEKPQKRQRLAPRDECRPAVT